MPDDETPEWEQAAIREVAAVVEREERALLALLREVKATVVLADRDGVRVSVVSSTGPVPIVDLLNQLRALVRDTEGAQTHA